jgi:hypothetical protein
MKIVVYRFTLFITLKVLKTHFIYGFRRILDVLEAVILLTDVSECLSLCDLNI